MEQQQHQDVQEATTITQETLRDVLVPKNTPEQQGNKAEGEEVQPAAATEPMSTNAPTLEETSAVEAVNEHILFTILLSCCSKKEKAKQIGNLILLLFASMFYKFALETMGGAVSLLVLNRYAYTANAATLLAVLNVCFFVSQSLATTMISPLLLKVRANIIVGSCMILFAIWITVLIILEAATGGTLLTEGSWPIHIIFPMYCLIGAAVGMIEVARKLIPPLILGNTSSVGLKKLNSAVHICYEIAGTAGAFASTPIIKLLKPIYAMSHMPILFTIAAILFFMVQHKFQDKETISEELGDMPPIPEDELKPTTNYTDTTGLVRESPARGCFRAMVAPIVHYFHGLWMGCKLMLFDRNYNWLILCFVIPQVLHRVLENMFVPLFTKEILKNGEYTGIIVGGSNLGEMLGALMLLVLSGRVSNNMVWVRFDAMMVTLLWVFPFIPDGNSGIFDPLGWALCLVPLMVLVSSSWAAGDISLLAYLQHTLPHRSADGKYSPLSNALSFLFSLYIFCVAIIGITFGQVADQFKSKVGNIRYGFITVCAIFSALSVVIIIVSCFAKPKIEQQQEQQQAKPEIVTQQPELKEPFL